MRRILSNNRNKIIMVALQGIASGSNFLLVILLSRIYGLEIFGVYSMVWLVLVFAMSMQQSLVLSPLLTFWAKSDDDVIWHHFFNYNLLIALLLSLFSTIFALVAPLIAPKWIIGDYAPEIFFMVFVFLLHVFNRRSLINKGHIYFAFVADAVAYLPVLIIILVWRPSLKFIFIWQIVCVATAILLSLFRLKPVRVPFTTITDMIKDVWNFASWLLLTGLFQWFSGNFFVVAAGTLLGAGPLGVIRLGQSAVGIFSVFFIAMENRVPFSAARIFKVNGKEALLKYLKDIFIKGSSITILVTALFVIFAKPFIVLLYGSKYADYSWVLIMFLLLQILVFISTLFQIAVRTIEKTRLIFFAYLTIATVSMITAFPVVKEWGIAGAIGGFFLAQITGIIFYLIFVKKQWEKI